MGALPARRRTMTAFRFSLNPQGARGEGVKLKSNDKNFAKRVFRIKLAFKLCKLIVCGFFL